MKSTDLSKNITGDKMQLNIDDNNMRILVLDNHPFFKFRKPETFMDKTFLFFEAKRFCFLHADTVSIPTDILIFETEKRPKSYFLDEHSLIYGPDKKIVGKFLTKKVCNKIRFVHILNYKSNFWSGS
jgi:hypothetical protein